MIYNLIQGLCLCAFAPSLGLTAPRADFVPYSGASACGFSSWNDSAENSRYAVLNGSWDFYYAPAPVGKIDSSKIAWQSITVPSAWETCDIFNNSSKKRKKSPQNLVGIYRKIVNIDDIDNQYFLNIDKIYGFVEVLLNGQSVGYSMTGSGEFDLSKNVVLGDNELIIAVTDNSSLTKFSDVKLPNLRGIVGNVSLITRKNAYLESYVINVNSCDVEKNAELELTVKGGDKVTARIELYDKKIVKSVQSAEVIDGKVKFTLSGDYKTYSPENPYLYDLYVSIFLENKEVECVPVKVGFGNVEIKEKEVYVSGAPYVLKGVHYDCVVNSNGNVMTLSDYEKDMLLLKSHNLNAVLVDEIMPSSFYFACQKHGIIVTTNPVNNMQKFAKRGKKANIYNNAQGFVDIFNAKVNAYNNTVACVANIDFLRNADVLTAPSINKAINDVLTVKKAVIVTDFVIGKTEASAKFDEYLDTLTKEDGFGGIFVKDFKNTFVNKAKQPLFSDNNEPSKNALLYKYAARPLRALIKNNRHVEVINTRAFIDSSDIKINVFKIRGESDQKIGTFLPTIAPGGAIGYDMYLGEYDAGIKLLVEYVNKFTGEHIASEYLNLVNVEEILEKSVDLRRKNFGYRVNKRIFSLRELSENVLPARAYFVPYSGERASLGTGAFTVRKRSDRVVSLSGNWDFAYFRSNPPTEFRSDSISWDSINLPCTWESAGYEPFEFTQGYPFDANLKTFEIIPTSTPNSTGIYRKIINIGDTANGHIISFSKVYGSIELHVNGRYVGYSMLGTAEFDISSYLNLGENEIVVIVKKWTPLAFLDGGDNFNASGIIGEVTLIRTRPCSLVDYDILVRKQGPEYLVDMTFLFAGSNANVKIELKNDNETIFEKTTKIENNLITIGIAGNFIGYSIENPKLYDLFIKVVENGFVSECTPIKVGFSHLDIVGDTAFYNDQPIKLRGVTYNPLYNTRGELLTDNDVKKDLALIKEYGFNMIQPLHYVSAEMVRYCKEIGLFVLPRLGINTQGCGKINEKMRQAVVNNGKFEKLINTVVEYAYSRDKDCVNIPFYQFVEDGNTRCIKSATNMLKEWMDKPILSYGNNGDAVSACYPTINGVLDLINDTMGKKPVFFTKYAYSKGIGCATMHEYEDLISNSPCCMGGCVAHFTDDFVKDSGNKAVGLFTYDRKPYPAADSIKYIYRPIKTELSQDLSTIVISNLNKFITTAKYKLVLKVMQNGHPVTISEIDPDILPGSDKEYDFVCGHIDGDCYLNVECVDKTTGKTVSVEQHVFNKELPRIEPTIGKEDLKFTELYDTVEIQFDCGAVTFNKSLGCITRYSIMGKDVLKPESKAKGAGSFVTNIYRPFVRNMNEQFPTHRMEVKDFEIENSNNKKEVHVNIESVIMQGKKENFAIQDKYIVRASGEIEVFSVLTPLRRGLPVMDCFGKQLRLRNTFGNVIYYGNGESDNYIDMKEHTTMGIYAHNVDKTFSKLTTLQEAGNRTDVRYAEIVDDYGDGIMLVANKNPYQLRVSPYSDKEIYDGYHSGKKCEQSGVYVDVNAIVSGIGTTNDGKPLPQYVIIPAEHILHFTLIPIHKN